LRHIENTEWWNTNSLFTTLLVIVFETKYVKLCYLLEGIGSVRSITVQL